VTTRSRGALIGLASSLGVVSSWLVPAVANAKEGEVQVGGLVGIGIPDYANVGIGGAVIGSYGLLEWLDIDAIGSVTGLHRPRSSAFLVSPRIGPTAKLDVANWVPYFGVTTGLYFYANADGRPDPTPTPGSLPDGYGGTNWGVSGAYGVDYLYSRTISFTGRIEHNILFASPVIYYHQIMVGAQFHFEL
jgi:hypothetical protein